MQKSDFTRKTSIRICKVRGPFQFGHQTMECSLCVDMSLNLRDANNEENLSSKKDTVVNVFIIIYCDIS